MSCHLMFLYNWLWNVFILLLLKVLYLSTLAFEVSMLLTLTILHSLFMFNYCPHTHKLVIYSNFGLEQRIGFHSFMLKIKCKISKATCLLYSWDKSMIPFPSKIRQLLISLIHFQSALAAIILILSPFYPFKSKPRK